MTDYQAYEAEIAALKAESGKLLTKLNDALHRNAGLSVANERLQAKLVVCHIDVTRLTAALAREKAPAEAADCVVQDCTFDNYAWMRPRPYREF